MTIGIQKIEIGQRVLITGDHPWAGHAGEFVRKEEIPFIGERPVVKLDGGVECFVMRPDQWQAIPVGGGAR